MEIQLLAGVYVDASPTIRTALPRNYVPTPKDTGISQNYFRPGDGLVEFGGASGIVRGAEVWNGVLYQVQGGQLARVDASGASIALGAIGGTGTVTMDYSFDRMGIAAGGRLYFYAPSEGVTVVTDPDIGTVLDMAFLDGYWLATDGTSIAQSELTNPYDWQITKYGSSEADPDDIKTIWRLKDELNAINRFTTETFQNVGGTGFAFSRVPTALVMCGAIGTHMVCEFADGLAVVGGGRGEPPSVYVLGGGDRTPIATAEVDRILQGYTESVLASCLLESRIHQRHEFLMLHLPDRTLVFDAAASRVLKAPIWYDLATALDGLGQYRAQHWKWAYDRWIFGDPQSSRTGTTSEAVSSHYGQEVGWELTTGMLYNAGARAVIHMLELVALPGRVPLGAKPTIWTSYSEDGETWSLEQPMTAGEQGQRARRMVWLQQGLIENYRIQRFRGTSAAHMPIAALQMQVEALNG